MAEIMMRVCDMCGEGAAAPYRIGKDNLSPWTVDLCHTCAEPISMWQKKGRAPSSGRRPYRKYKVEDTQEAL